MLFFLSLRLHKNFGKQCNFIATCMYSIIGAPSVPNPPRVSHVTCSSVMVSWNTSLDNGGPMVHYIVRYRPIESIITDLEYIPWCQQNTSDVRTLINDLLPGAIYLVGVEAHNDIGSSASSESTLFITQSPGKANNMAALLISCGGGRVGEWWGGAPCSQKTLPSPHPLITKRSTVHL